MNPVDEKTRRFEAIDPVAELTDLPASVEARDDKAAIFAPKVCKSCKTDKNVRVRHVEGETRAWCVCGETWPISNAPVADMMPILPPKGLSRQVTISQIDLTTLNDPPMYSTGAGGPKKGR